MVTSRVPGVMMNVRVTAFRVWSLLLEKLGRVNLMVRLPVPE